MTDKTAFEQWWSHKCADHGIRDTDSLFKAIGNEAWEAAIDAAISVCREVTEWDDHCTSGAKECDTLIQRAKR